MKTHIKPFQVLLDGLWRGIGSPADMLIVNRYVYPHESELAAIRDDWQRIGDDIRRVISREHVKTRA